jgi:hypothetical protein
MSLSLTILDLNGNVVFNQVISAGSQQSATVFLQAGDYQISIIAVADPAVLATSLNYSLAAATITSPIGAVVVNTTTTPANNLPPATGTAAPPNPNGPTATWVVNVPSDGSNWF